MKLSSVTKIEKHKVISHIQNNFLDVIDKSFNEYLPIIINGIYTLSEVWNILPKVNITWIEPNETQVKKAKNILENCDTCHILTSLELSKMLLSDVSLSNINATLVINNFHYKDPYTDLIVSNITYIQKQRKLINKEMLKIILLTYPLPNDVLIKLFGSSIIIQIENNFNVQSINLDCEVTPDNYLEGVFKTIYLLFRSKIDGLDLLIDTTKLKVLVFLADSTDVRISYKWLTSRLMSMINAYIVVVDNAEVKKSLSSYSSLLVLSCCTDKSVLNSLNVDFDYVIDSGFVSCRRINKASRVNCLCLERLEPTDILIRNYYVTNPYGKAIQLYPIDKRLPYINSNVNFSNYLKIKEDITDFLFCLIALGEKSWQSYAENFVFLPLPLKCGIENLIKCKLICKSKVSLAENNQLPKVILTVWNHELTELGKKCLKFRPLDCQSASVLISAFENECFVSCLTLISLLQSSEDLFIDLYNSEADHIKKLREIYDGDDDFKFLITLYRIYLNLPKEKRTSFLKGSSLNKASFTKANQLRTKIKENFPFPLNAKTNSDNVTPHFVAAYPYQIAKYSKEEKMYMRPGSVKVYLHMDPHSFAYNIENPPLYVFYYSAYTEGGNTYMKYVSPITQDIWNEYTCF